MDALFRDIEQFDRTAIVPKDWGYEVWHFNTEKLCMKTLVIYPGHACSFHWHDIKYEIFICLDSGPKNQLYMSIGDREERLLKRGEHIIIHPGVRHTFRVVGTEPGALLEFSTHHRESDSYRMWRSHKFGGGKVNEFLGQVALLKGKKILFIGDISLDEYWSGECTRISPEAAVPLVNMDPYAPDIRQMPGCVGNVAVSCNALGGSACVVSVIGDDSEGEDLAELLRELTIDTSLLLTTDKRPTIIKRRIFAGHQYITRIDKEASKDFDEEMEKAVLLSIHSALDEFKPEVVYIADYDKGMMTKEVIAGTVAAAQKKGVCVIADPKLRHFHHYSGVDIFKPNDVRAATAMGMEAKTISDVELLAQAILDELDCENLILTRGGKGSYMVDYHGKTNHMPAIPVAISELSGAGDTYGAALALGIAAEMDLFDAAEIANVAASIVVQKTGTAFCTPSELAQVLANT